MVSSMLSGERRWTSARRGGMTVLGKVAVPKPVNLPSQRLEKHGLYPNLEIVPKGALNWGIRSSSSASNAWGSSALSPRSTDGVADSPSRFSGHPSSSGCGTRPSTAGSDRSHEPASNVWGPNSQPLSASGILASNQTLTATMQPCSAETRPGSSQLSRFAEPISENSVAWVASGTAEKLGAASSKINRFTLSSGDFPTLGSEKNAESHGQQGHSSQGYPVSGSGGVARSKESSATSPIEDEHIDANTEWGSVNTWKRDSSPCVGDGAPTSTDKWQRDSQPFPNTNMPPQHLGPWHGTPVRNSSEGVWYRGPPSGPPYGTSSPPGSYPLEPFNYYHQQVPVRALANSQPVPRPVAGPSGYHPRNGDSYQPQMHESYFHPMMPVRPGVYPGMVPYEGYYGPPRVGFYNSGKRDAPIMGMAAGPCVYNRYPNQNLYPNSGNFHARSSGFGSSSTEMTKEQMEFGHYHDTQQGPCKVLPRQHDGWKQKDGEEKREYAITTNAPHLERGHQPRISMRESEWGTNNRKNEVVDLPKTAFGEVASSRPADNREGSLVPVGMNISGGMRNVKAVDDSLITKPETGAIPERGSQLFSATKRNPTLIDKIEGAKARIYDDQYDVGPVSSRNAKMEVFTVVNANIDRSMNEAGTGAITAKKTYFGEMAIPSSEVGTSMGNESLELAAASGTADSMSVYESQASTGNMLNSEVGEKPHSQIHNRVHGVEGRVNYRGKGRPSNQEGEEWIKKPFVAKSMTVVPVANTETSDVILQDFHASYEPSEKSELNLRGKSGEEYATSTSDPSSYNAQRAKMRELAIQRFEQLQKEEEEWTRVQKAKSLAKLEELNRRTLAEGSTQKFDQAVPLSLIQQKQEGSQFHAVPNSDMSNSREAPNSALSWSSNAVAQMRVDNTNEPGESTNLSINLPLEAANCAPQENVLSQNSSLLLRQDVNILEFANPKIEPQVQESVVSEQKQMNHERKQNMPSDKNLSERLIPIETTGGSRSHSIVVMSVIASSSESGLPSNASTMNDPSPQPKKKTNRSGKSRYKMEEAFYGTQPSSVPTEGISVKASAETGKLKASEAVLEASSVHALTSRGAADGQDSQDVIPSSDQGWTLPTEEADGRANNQGKPQPHRMPRNQQATRSAVKFHGGEAVVWAPMRSQNKNEASEEASHHTTLEVNTSLMKNGHGMQNNTAKSKRAEMERYVPKPVAKEMSQQGNTERPLSPSIDQITSDKATWRADGSQSTESCRPDGWATGKIGFTVEAKNGESRHNKHGKAHGSWRQRGSTESLPVQGSLEGSSFPVDPIKIALKPIEQHQPPKPETYSPKGSAGYSDDWTNNPISTELVTGSVVKDHSLTGKGRQHPFKGYKDTGHNHNPVDHKDLHGGVTDKTDTQSSGFELSQPDGRITLRESHGVGEHSTSHWQPKSQPYLAYNRQESRANGGQKVTRHVGRTTEKKSTSQGGGHLPSQDNKDDTASPDQSHPHPSESQKINVAEVSAVHHQEAKKERKAVESFKEHPSSPRKNPVNLTELGPPANIVTQHEKHFSSGLRRHGQHDGCFGRVQELPHGGHTPAGQDSSKQHHLPSSSDKRRQTSHYEYQPIESHNNKLNDMFEVSADGSHVMGSRYREKGQNHFRRGGNYYGQNSGPVRVAAGYDNGE